MDITIIGVGKIKEKYFTDAIKEYSKRLKSYCNINIIEVQDEKTSENASFTEEELTRDKEADRILKVIPKDSFIITLEINGKMLSSEDLATKISELGLYGNSKICFIIGGSIGLSKKVLSLSNFALSFSKMTFPHQLMRVVLLEQIYRAFRIINNHPYHK